MTAQTRPSLSVDGAKRHLRDGECRAKFRKTRPRKIITRGGHHIQAINTGLSHLRKPTLWCSMRLNTIK